MRKRTRGAQAQNPRLAAIWRRARIQRRKDRQARYKRTRALAAYRRYVAINDPPERWLV